MPLAASSNTCCSPCDEPLTTAVPGTAGVNAYTLAASFTMPAELANVTVTVGNSMWMAVGQILFVSDGTREGYFEVQSKPSSTSVILKNLETTGQYSANSAPGSVFSVDAIVSPAGLQAGTNAFSTADSFVMPAEQANVTVTTTSSEWMGIGQIVFAAGGGFEGYFEVISKADTTHAVLKNLENTATSAYTDNSPPATVFPNLTTLSPSGSQGPPGSTPATALLSANNLSDVDSAGTSRTNLGLGTAATRTIGISDTNVAPVDDAGFTAGEAVFATATGIESQVAATARTTLGLGSIATQAANLVNIDGGAIDATTIGASTPSTAGVTTLTQTAQWVQTPSALQTLLAATAIAANAAKIRVVGSPGAVTLTATPTISAGTADGQRLLIKGTHATNTVTLQDESSLAGTTLELGAATRALGLNSQIELSWDSTTSKWVEISFSANT